MTATMLSCKGDMEHRLKGGMVITVKGDTKVLWRNVDL